MPFQVLKNIKLNLLRPELTVVHGKQYDNEARVITAQLFEDNVKWYAPANTLGVISYIKPDGNYGFYDETDLHNPAVVFDENDRSKVTLVLSTQTMTCAGKVKVEVNFYDQQQAERLSCFAFTLDVEQSTITQNDLTSSSEFRILAQQITEVLTAAANLSGMEADAETTAAGTDADVVVTGGTEGNPYHLHFKIPRGNTGAKGDRGYAVATVRKKSGTGAAGTVDKYELVNEDQTVVGGEISVYNGSDGQGAPSSTTPKMDGNAAAGVETGYARGDHVHPHDTSKLDSSDFVLSTGTPEMDGTASAGVSTEVARADHVHPSDMSKLDASEFILSDNEPYSNGNASSGMSNEVSRADHVHPFEYTRTTSSKTGITWNIYKFAEGLMIQYGIYTFNWSSSGNVLVGTTGTLKTSATVTVQFAESFNSQPMVSVTPSINGTVVSICGYSRAVSSSVDLYVLSTASGSISTQVSIIAIGRWK